MSHAAWLMPYYISHGTWIMCYFITDHLFRRRFNRFLTNQILILQQILKRHKCTRKIVASMKRKLCKLSKKGWFQTLFLFLYSYFETTHSISLKPSQVGTILNDIFFLIFIKINEKFEPYFYMQFSVLHFVWFKILESSKSLLCSIFGI